MEQQYTCPFCFKDYTRFTIHEHYGCGVEPLETTEDLNAELESISEEVIEQENPQFTAEEIEKAKAEQAKPLEVNKIEKSAPKKRGRKPKAKV